MTLAGNRVLAGVGKATCLTQMTGVLIKGGHLETEPDAQKTDCEETEGEHVNAQADTGVRRLSAEEHRRSWPNARRLGRGSEQIQPHWRQKEPAQPPSELRLLAPRPVRQHISAVEASRSEVLCHTSPSRLIQVGFGHALGQPKDL